jgi:hypothetical protein
MFGRLQTFEQASSSLFRRKMLEEMQETRRERFALIFAFDTFAAGCAELGPQFLRLAQSNEARSDLLRSHHISRGTMLHNPVRVPCGRGNDWKTGGHRLQQNVGKSFRVRRENQ